MLAQLLFLTGLNIISIKVEQEDIPSGLDESSFLTTTSPTLVASLMVLRQVVQEKKKCHGKLWIPEREICEGKGRLLRSEFPVGEIN